MYSGDVVCNEKRWHLWLTTSCMRAVTCGIPGRTKQKSYECVYRSLAISELSRTVSSIPTIPPLPCAPPPILHLTASIPYFLTSQPMETDCQSHSIKRQVTFLQVTSSSSILQIMTSRESSVTILQETDLLLPCNKRLQGTELLLPCIKRLQKTDCVPALRDSKRPI